MPQGNHRKNQSFREVLHAVENWHSATAGIFLTQDGSFSHEKANYQQNHRRHCHV